MAKGEKKTCSKLEKTVVQHKGSSKETKENNPEMSQDFGKAPPTIQSLLSPNKSRSPLSNHSSVLIQEGNGSDKCHIDTSNLKKGRPNEVNCESRDSKEQNSRKTCPVPGSSEPIFERQEKDSISQINPGPAPDNVSVSKTGRGTRHKIREKKTENKASQNRKVTDYFPIRRSSRKTKAELMIEEHQHLDDLIKNGVEEGLQIQNIEGKGRGVFAQRRFKKGDFVVEYHGDLMELVDAKEREAQYALDPNTGCYMYYFQYHCKTFCVDATKETNRLGRLINHSKIGNCQTKLHDIDGRPHLILVASRDIEAEEELLYDYGDRSKASISAHPWLKY